MLTLPSTVKASRRPAIEAVAVVASEDIVASRIHEALLGVIQITEEVADVAELSEATARADAIVLASGTSASHRKTLIRSVKKRFPATPVVVVAPASSNGIYKTLDAGGAGFVYELQIEAALTATIRAVAAGQVAVPRQERQAAVRPALSHREKQTLALVAMGLTNREIADRLFLAESTIKTHLTSVFGKLGVRSRTEAAALLLDPEEKLGLGALRLSSDAPPVDPGRTEPR